MGSHFACPFYRLAGGVLGALDAQTLGAFARPRAAACALLAVPGGDGLRGWSLRGLRRMAGGSEVEALSSWAGGKLPEMSFFVWVCSLLGFNLFG